MNACTQTFIVAVILLTASIFLILKWLPARAKQQLHAWCGRHLPFATTIISTKTAGCGTCSSGGCGTCSDSDQTKPIEKNSKRVIVIKRV
jgi:hypothetical protein